MYTGIVNIFLVSIAIVTASSKESSPDIVAIPGGLRGDAITTRYWDCCVVSCSWDANVHTKNRQPVKSCQKDGATYSTRQNNGNSVCYPDHPGNAYVCNNNSPFVVNSTLAYGFAGVSFQGGADVEHCCHCYLLSFKGKLQGKQMLVQTINTGADAVAHHFDLQIPGGGVGYNTQGCRIQWNAPENGWGDRYGGVHSEQECNQLPWQLQAGCKFRFQFMQGVSNPDVSFQEVKCPSQLVSITGCGDL
uniref:Cellulase n=1 Tax=Diabrotica virgifera virgifera TaxID=50390 RepID=A0A6P7FKI0_DIAVI